MYIGTAWKDITPLCPIPLMGQMRPRLGEYVHDPLTINAVAVEAGETQAILVSCDLGFLPDRFIRDVQSLCADKLGISASSVLIGCTHSHLAPYTVSNTFGQVDPAFMDQLRDDLVEVVARARADLEAVEVYAGSGRLDQMGFNRRGLHGEGRADMYYGSWKEGFLGVEGPRDGQVSVIFAKRPKGDLKVIIPSFSTHPNSVEGESYYSADLVGAVRLFLRKNLSEDLGIVYLTGAAGNTAPSQLENNPKAIHPWRGEEGWKRSGVYLGSEILKIIAGTVDPMPDPVFRVAQKRIPVSLRRWPDSFHPADLPPGGHRDYFTRAYEDWPRMLQEENPVEVRLNVIRIGDAAICTNPAELFVEYGLAMKEKSPARVTLISELTDGYVGYVPTLQAFKNGGYCTRPAPTSKLAENAGELITEHTIQLLERVFK